MPTIIRTFEDLQTYAKANFAAVFRQLSNPQRYHIIDDGFAIRLMIGKFTCYPGLPAFACMLPTGSVIPVGNNHEYRFLSDVDIDMPFSWLCWGPSEGYHVPQKLDAYVWYCLLSRGYEREAQMNRVKYDFLAVFEEIYGVVHYERVAIGAETYQKTD